MVSVACLSYLARVHSRRMRTNSGDLAIGQLTHCELRLPDACRKCFHQLESQMLVKFDGVLVDRRHSQ